MIKRGAVGDTLAEFAAIEIREIAQPHTDAETAAGECADAIERAASQLSKVAEALRDVQADAAE